MVYLMAFVWTLNLLLCPGNCKIKITHPKPMLWSLPFLYVQLCIQSPSRKNKRSLFWKKNITNLRAAGLLIFKLYVMVVLLYFGNRYSQKLQILWSMEYWYIRKLYLADISMSLYDFFSITLSNTQLTG